MENWVKKFLKISLKTFLYKFVYCAFFRKKKKRSQDGKIKYTVFYKIAQKHV